ncbi:MAG: hypothetical protein H0V44_13400 [Planctomycetes bacterium]|nr:hypothetical protein [Planctomycetota bacterium]
MKRILTLSLSASLITAWGLSSATYAAAAAAEGDPAHDPTPSVIDQVPAAAQAALKARAGEDRISAIEQERRDGTVVYTARIEQRGLDRKITVSETGTIISDNRHEQINKAVAKVDEAKDDAKRAWDRRATTSDPLKLDDLPKPAQECITTEAAGNEVGVIRGGVEQGKVYYRADIRFSDGSERQIKVSEQGELLSQR